MKTFYLLLMATASFVTASCQPAQNSRLKVIGGHPTTEHRPWLVQLLSEASSPRGFCGGTLIAPQIVLTAAHCIEASEVLNLHVAMGLADGENIHLNHPVKVRGIIVHPDYSAATSKNDIAVLYLENYSAERFEMPAAPLPFNRSSEIPESNGPTTRVVGLGNTSSFGRLFDKIIREVDLPLVATEKCAEKYEGVDSTQVCAGNWDVGGLDTCQGDSGGPLVSQAPSGEWSLVGITSFGDSCAQKGAPGVYTRVSAFASWIDLAVEQLILPRADQVTPDTMTLLLKTHCVAQFGFISIDTSDGASKQRSTIYSLDLRALKVDVANESPTGEEMNTCDFEDHGKSIHAKLVRLPATPGTNGVTVSVVANIDSQTYASSYQSLSYQQDTLTCSTALGNIRLVDQRTFTTVFIHNQEYSLGLPTADPLPNLPISGCAVADASIEVFHELQSDNSSTLAARINHRSLGLITVKLLPITVLPVKKVKASLSWGGTNRGTFQIDNQLDDDIFTWNLECSAPFSLELENGHTLTSSPSSEGTWSGVYIDSAIYSEGTIKAGSARTMAITSLASQNAPASRCKINNSVRIDTTR